MHETQARRGVRRGAAVLLAMVLALSLGWQRTWADEERQLIPVGKAVGIKLFADGVLVVSVSPVQGAEETRSPAKECGLKEGDILLTYYDPATGSYGALGHGITDVDTAELMPLASGSIMETMVKAVKKGQRGDPGELKGDFTVQRDVGTVTVNSNEGIFGTVEDAGFISGEAVSVAEPEEVHAGEASILCTISGSDTRAYEVEILRVNPRSRDGRDLLLRVTDPELLETTGGIVQGMSGSPILQDGRLVGAVTHVLVANPAEGYGIFLENMLTTAG